MKKLYCPLICLFLLLIASCITVAEAENRIYTTGSSTVAPLILELARLYEEKTGKVQIEIATGGSSRGVADALKGVVDFGMVSRALHSEEESLGLKAITVAYDGIAMIVHKSNPVKELTSDQIRAIYTGSLTNWKEVGGIDTPVVVVNKAHGRSTLELFLQYFSLKPQNVKASTIIGDNQQGIKLVSRNPNAIGYVSIGAAEYETNRGVSIRTLPLNGVNASIDNIKNRRYPLVRPLNLVVHRPLSEEARNFVNFVTSSEASKTVSKLYFVSLHE